MKKQSNSTTNRPIYLASSLLQINHINPKVDLSLYDALIFTSKNGVKSIDQNSEQWKDIDSYAISQVTANTIEELNGNLVFIGHNGHGDEFAKEIVDKLKDKRVLYIRAKKVVSNLTKILNDNNIKCDSSVYYETVCDKSAKILKLEQNAIIIFTSPSTIKCFFDKYKWKKNYTAIAIGRTTASYLSDDIDMLISKNVSIESSLELAQTL